MYRNNINRVTFLYCLCGILPLLFVDLRYLPAIEMMCVEVLDGDTIRVKFKDREEYRKVRLIYIDAPELAQGNVANRSKKYLQKHIEKKNVHVDVKSIGYYGRWLAEVSLPDDEETFNFKLVKNGLVSIYPYSGFNSVFQKNKYLRVLKYAISKRVGIWGMKKFINPYYYRKMIRRRARRRAN